MSQWEQFWRNAESVASKAFLAPPYLWFLGLIPIVILLYLLKLRRTQVVIASTLLWQKTLEDLTANAPFQRLRKNLLLLLQILILLLAALAMSRPFFKSSGAAGQNLCVIIDRSASMQATEDNGTRIDLAKNAAMDMVNAMQRGDKMMVVTFAENSDVLRELTEDRSRLKQAIASIEPNDTRTKLRDAFFVAHSLRLTIPDLHAVVISDGNIGDLADIGPRVFGQTRQVADQSTEARSRGYDISFLQVGKNDNNVGITAFSERVPNEGETGERQALVAVRNAGSEPTATTVTLAFDDQILAVEGVELEPNQTRELVFAHSDLGLGILKATLDSDDALAVDNSAWLSLRPAAKLRVLLVADPAATGTYFLQRVLAPDARVELGTLAPANYAPSSDYDLTVFYNFAPQTLPPGTLLFINALPPVEGMTSAGAIENPPIIAIDSEHPLMRFNLNPSNVGIRTAVQATLPQGARPVVSTTGGALIADVSRAGQQIAWVAFDLADSDWPLNLSFPLFFQNVLAWVPRSALASENSVDAGKPLTLMPESTVAAAKISQPNGAVETVPLDPLRPVFYSNTQRTGLYAVETGERRDQFAVNLLDMTETNIKPSESLDIGRGEFGAERGNIRQNRELWRWLLAAAIGVLALEWWVFSRRAWM